MFPLYINISWKMLRFLKFSSLIGTLAHCPDWLSIGLVNSLNLLRVDVDNCFFFSFLFFLSDWVRKKKLETNLRLVEKGLIFYLFLICQRISYL
jgi:hypothetical protein